MSYAPASYPGEFSLAAYAGAEARATFLRRTYGHLAAAIGLFVILEAVLLRLPGVERLVATMTGGYGWLIVLGAFMVVSWIAHRWANSAVSLGTQYMGLVLYVVAESIIFVPLLWVADNAFPGQNLIPTAGLLTLIIFTGLSAVVFITGKDFSFLRVWLMLGGLVALGFIVCSLLFGFELYLVFTTAMIALASGYVVFHTSNVLHHYQTTQYVAAALALFAAIALLFWYVIRLLMILNSRD